MYKEYHKRASEAAKHASGTLALISLVYWLVVGALGSTFILGLLFSGALIIGMLASIAANAKGEEITVGSLFSHFGDFAKHIGIYFLGTLFVALWLLVPIYGIVQYYAHQFMYLVHLENPEMTACEAIRESKRLLKGHKWELFVLELSYIGWFLLSCLTFGILLLWVYPKYATAIYYFYQDIKNKDGQNVTEQPASEQETLEQAE